VYSNFDIPNELSISPDWVFRPLGLATNEKRMPSNWQCRRRQRWTIDEVDSPPDPSLSRGFSGLTCFQFSHNFCGPQGRLTGILSIPLHTIPVDVNVVYHNLINNSHSIINQSKLHQFHLSQFVFVVCRRWHALPWVLGLDFGIDIPSEIGTEIDIWPAVAAPTFTASNEERRQEGSRIGVF